MADLIGGDRELAHNYLSQAKAVLDFIIIHADESDDRDEFGRASKEVSLGAIDAAVSLIQLADREFRATA